MMVMAEVPTEAVEMGEVRDARIRRKRSNLVESFAEVNSKQWPYDRHE